MATELNRRLSDMAERGEWRGSDANLTAARVGLAPDVVSLSPELRRLPGWVFAFGAAALVLVLIGGVALLRAGPDSGFEVAGEIPATILVPESEAPVPPAVKDSAPVPATAPESTPTEAPSPTEPLLPPQAMDWSRISLGVEGEVLTVIPGGPGFIAGGYVGNGDAAVWASTDGTTWERVPHDDVVFGGAGTQKIVDLAAGDNGFVAVGGDVGGAIWFSADGVSWQRVPDSPVFATEWLSFDSVAHGPSGFVATGADADPDGVFRQNGGTGTREWTGAIWTSRDGLVWERAATDNLSQSLFHEVTATESGFLAVGFYWAGNDANVGIWVSEDGHTWSHHPDEPDHAGWGEMEGVDVHSGRMAATGYQETASNPCPDDDFGPVAIWLSDGTSWSFVKGDGEQFCGGPGHAVAQSGDEIVIVGTRGVVVGPHEIVTVGTRGVVSGPDSPVVATAWVSSDAGVTWHRTDMSEDVFGPTKGITAMWDLVESGDGYVAVGVYDNEAAVWTGTWNEEDG